MMAGRILTVPNQITLLRLGFLPLFIIAILYDHYRWALLLLILAGLTDLFDGLLARRLGQRTALGAYLDPVADKLLLSSSFVLLAVKAKLDWWLAILVLGRDLLILAVSAAILLVVHYREFPPSLYGKANTLCQILLVLAVLANEVAPVRWLAGMVTVFVYLVAAFTVISGLHYAVVIAQRLSQQHEPTRPKPHGTG
ncbi:MAG: CDP-alcohol phosphatidyltransferase family protein [Firmicutes bacterium]|nr:CDP-alcohol phosphatidyltransferase family protein [Bacillota bacterium]